MPTVSSVDLDRVLPDEGTCSVLAWLLHTAAQGPDKRLLLAVMTPAIRAPTMSQGPNRRPLIAGGTWLVTTGLKS